MGLDMYLDAKITWYPHMDGHAENFKKIAKAFPEINKPHFEHIAGVHFRVGYWRKANQIHAWFVRNVQDKQDNCGSYYVSRDQLLELRDLCVQVLTDNKTAEDLLPVQEGFFFGPTTYDEYYFEELKRTIEIIDKCIELPEDYDFEYSSSW